jgi:hypothetical protein
MDGKKIGYGNRLASADRRRHLGWAQHPAINIQNIDFQIPFSLLSILHPIGGMGHF